MYGMYFNKLIYTKILIKQSLDQLDYTNSFGNDLVYYVNFNSGYSNNKESKLRLFNRIKFD